MAEVASDGICWIDDRDFGAEDLAELVGEKTKMCTTQGKLVAVGAVDDRAAFFGDRLGGELLTLEFLFREADQGGASYADDLPIVSKLFDETIDVEAVNGCRCR